jgi:hypothetical protein
MSSLTATQTVELAELIAMFNADENGAHMPLDEALRLVEGQETYDLSLPPFEYLLHLRFFSLYMSHGDLIPQSKMRDGFIFMLNHLKDQGTYLLDLPARQKLRKRFLIIGAVVGSVLTSALLFSIFCFL